jgi:FkbM family methyltransferase
MLKRILAWPILNPVITFLVKEIVVDGLDKRPGFIRSIPKRGLVRLDLPDGGAIRLLSPGDDRIVDRLFFRNWDGYEPGMGEAFFTVARSAEVVLDIGAHVGFYSLLATAATPGATVYAFEPLDRVRSRLERNIAINRATIRVVPAAVGASQGEINIYSDPFDAAPGESTLSGKVGAAKGFPSTSTVKVVTVDSFVSDRALPRVDLVKIDTEATELDVLEGMQDTLATFHPVIFCEVLDDFADARRVEQLTAPHGYRYWMLTSDGPVARPGVIPDRDWPNYLLAVELPPGLDPART